MTATQNPAQDVSAALTVVNDAANDARHRGDYDRANALVRARVTLYQAARELQQPVAYLLDSEDPRDRAASTCNTVAETWREAGFTVVELTRISQ